MNSRIQGPLDGDEAGAAARPGPTDGRREATDANGDPAFAADGTDLTVIRWMLAMSPDDRLTWLENHMRAVTSFRRVQPRP